MDDHKGLQWARAAWDRRMRPLRQNLPGQRPPGYWAKWANRLLSRLASIALILVLAYQLARIAWAVIPGAPVDDPAPVLNPETLPTPSTTPVVDIQAIVDAHLFGAYVEQAPEPVVQIMEAPETELDLALKATVSETREHRLGAAVIASAGVDKTYTVGDEIDGTDGAVLHAIYSDRVIVDLAGQLQALRLPQGDATDNSLTFVGSRTTAPIVPSLRQTLNENASRLSAIVHAVPHIEQGDVVGFRLNPGGEPAAFEALGFRPGDVVTEINGASLTEAGQALEVFERLGESTQANLVLIRDGAPRVVTIDTSVVEAPVSAP